MKVYLVEDVGNSPGLIYAVFADEEDAIHFCELIEYSKKTSCNVDERHVWYGQPNNLGVNA